MKRALILSILIFVGISAEGASFFPPLQPLGNINSPMQNYNNNINSLPEQIVQQNSASYSNISQIEQALFGRNYSHQNISARLSRIERSLFTTTYPNATNTQRIDNIISNFNQMNKYPNISKNVLSRIESQMFSQVYPMNNSERRIERIEQQLFGATQSGDIEARYKAIQMAAKNYRRNDLNQQYPSQIAQSGWKGLMGNFGNALMGGSMTGFTPALNPYNTYNNYNSPSQNGYGMYRGYGVNRGLGGFSYGDSFNNYGSGSSVTILD